MSALVTTLSALVTLDRANDLLAAHGLPAMDDKEKALGLVIKASGIKSQEGLAALTVNLTEGKISGSELTTVLQAGFPASAGYKVGTRHGPHYLSLCRTGKIAVDFTPAKGGKAKVEATSRIVNVPDPRTPVLEAQVTELETKVNDLTALLELVREAKSIKDVREVLKAGEVNEA